MEAGLPEGFVRRRCRGWRIAVRKELADALDAAGDLDPASLSGKAVGEHRGRGRPRIVPLPDGSRGVLRRYRHGGALRGMTGRLFLGAPRPLRELRATERSRAAGVRVPEVLAAWHRGVGIVLHEGFLMTREVTGVRDLVAVLSGGGRARAAFADLGREVRRMHDAGVWHADLHVKNVLVGEEGATIIDFDRARVGAAVGARDRHANLLRFDRSVVKLALGGVRASVADRLRLFRAYYGGRPPADELATLLARCRRSLKLHRMTWRTPS